MRLKPLFAALIWLSLPCAVAGFALAQTGLAVPVDSSIYEDLIHFRALGLLDANLEIRPIQASAISDAIDRIELRRRGLNAAESIRLSRLRAWNELLAEPAERSFRFDSAPSGGEAGGAASDDRFHWTRRLEISYRGSATDLDSLTNLDRRPRRQGLLALSADFGISDRFTVQLLARGDYDKSNSIPGGDNWLDNLPRRPLDPGDYVEAGDIHLDRAVAAYSSGWWSIRIGRETRSWGVGRRGSLLLSPNPPPLDGVSFNFQSRYVRGASLFVQSRRGSDPPPLSAEDPYDGAAHEAGDAYVTVHRFEIGPWRRATLGLTEAVAYGGRGIDFAYINPVGLWTAMTQDIVDRSGANDKKLVSADIRFDLAPVEIYGELLVDRIVALEVAQAGSNSEISSFAEQIGLHWASPLGFAGADFEVEYTHIDPQVYFHADSDIRRALLAEGAEGSNALIGHWMGPNSDNVYLRISAPGSGRWGRFALAFEQGRWGMINGMLGTEIGFFSLRKSEKRWITGDKAVERLAMLSWEKPDLGLALPGIWALDLRLARVARSGVWDAGGWQAELEVDWSWGSDYVY